MSKTKMIVLGTALAALVILAIGFSWVRYLDTAHSTFEHYYAFRGCTELVERTDSYGICKTRDGETIKIVLYQGKWFLDGDLPCASGLCW